MILATLSGLGKGISSGHCHYNSHSFFFLGVLGGNKILRDYAYLGALYRRCSLGRNMVPSLKFEGSRWMRAEITMMGVGILYTLIQAPGVHLVCVE